LRALIYIPKPWLKIDYLTDPSRNGSVESLNETLASIGCGYLRSALRLMWPPACINLFVKDRPVDEIIIVAIEKVRHNFALLMAKGNNVVGSETITVTVSEQSKRLLEQLAQRGIYGRNPADVAGRFVDAALQQFIEPPKLSAPRLKLRTEAKRNRRTG